MNINRHRLLADRRDMESPNQESGQEQAAADRRRAARQSLVTKALIYPDQPCANPQRVALRDISLLGVAFDSPVPFEPHLRTNSPAGLSSTTRELT